MKVLLVGNYPGDRQWSMDRFCRMLLDGLREEGIEAEVIRPAVVLGARNKWLGYADKFLIFPFALRRAVKARPGWIVHILDQGNGIYAGWVPGCVVTCHDLLAIRAARGEFPGQRTRWSGRILQAMILWGLRKAGRIVCVSKATQSDAERLLGKSEVIPNGLEDTWQPMVAEEAWLRIEKAGVPTAARSAGYILHVGGDQWYKNRDQVVRTFIDLRKNGHTLKLVMVGPGLNGALVSALKETCLTGEVTVLNGLPDETVRALYSMAGVFLFPSIAEGFGWPILEAQACGCPVVTSDKEPMQETGGAAAVYATDEGWTKSVAGVLDMEQPCRVVLVAAGLENARRFTVRKMARAYIEFYSKHVTSIDQLC